MTEEEKQYLISEYMSKKKTVREIAADMNLSYTVVSGFIKRAKKKGTLPKERRNIPMKNRREYGYVLKKKKVDAETTLKPGEYVRCTLKVAKTCKYGLQTDHCGLCDYQAKKGTSRILVSPDPKHCTVYAKK